ncbi:MAG: sigma-54 dependent transcriptional regulator [Desulfobulbaceae bacterium]|nr:sigma-54 dependent transcriptional regulator [Desulfobulbaceae bacterium]
MTTKQDYPIMLVDDEVDILNTFELQLNFGGYHNIIRQEDSREILPLLAEIEADVILLDLAMPHLSGQELLPQLTEQYPEIPVIIVTGQSRLEVAIDCMKNGAFDYLVKPVENMRLVTAVRRAVELRDLSRENKALKQRVLSKTIEHPQAFSSIITTNPAMFSCFQYMEAVAPSPEPVLITGETGVGKELIAKAIHALSNRQGPFVAVNVAGLDDTQFADTLFGHKKGAFTGADTQRRGMISEASGGTLFLDEIGDMSLPSQIKLLRLIQEKEYLPLGADVPQMTDARILTATNCDLKELDESGKFRRDLYYRLRTHHVNVPPLRERLDDLPLLLEHFLEKAAEKLDKKKPTPPRELIDLLSTYHFPGNVRELEAMVIDAVSKHQSGTLSMQTFREQLVAATDQKSQPQTAQAANQQNIFSGLDVLPSLKENSYHLITEAMRRAKGNQTIAAQLLGISQPALSKRLKTMMP